MGYYVNIEYSNAVIPVANLEQAYREMCALNTTHDDKKRGGSWADGKQKERWFSWMDANYPETCDNTLDILEQLGFECEYNDAGDLLIVGYDSKMGQEDLFLNAIADLIQGRIEWQGEDGETWEQVFLG